MSVLGVVIRCHAKHQELVRQRLARTPGVDLGPDASAGRLVAVIESTADIPAASTMSEITGWSEVLNLSLVFEHSGDELAEPGSDFDFHAWRGHVGDFARRQAPPSSLSVSLTSTSAAPGAGEAR